MRQALAVVLTFAFAASTAMAQQTVTETRQPRHLTETNPSRGAVNDNLFVAAAAAAGMAEVASSQLAVQRAGSPEVKQFAQKMVEDHTKANRELMALAAAKRIPVPTALEVSAQAEGQILAGLSGEEFDHCYAHQQHAAHICAVGLFKAESERGQDPEIKAWAAKTLPTLKAHRHMIKQMADAHEAREKKENTSTH